MPRKICDTPASRGYGIKIVQHDGTVGWMSGHDGNVLLFRTEKETDKLIAKLKSDSRYSWNVASVTVEEYTGSLR